MKKTLEYASALFPVPFRDATLFLAELNGEPYVPMRPVVEGMGMNWKGQYEKIKVRYETCVEEIHTQLPGDIQRRTLTCLALRKLPGWLMSIYPNKVKASIRDTVIAYQNECDDVLWAHWSQKFSSPHFPPSLNNLSQPLPPPDPITSEVKLAIEQRIQDLTETMRLDFTEAARRYALAHPNGDLLDMVTHIGETDVEQRGLVVVSRYYLQHLLSCIEGMSLLRDTILPDIQGLNRELKA
jgi:hypothetical protein